MKTLKILLLGLILMFTFSCGEDESPAKPDDSLKASQITGIWKSANIKIKDNSCNLGEIFINHIKEDTSCYKISGEGENLDFMSCEDPNCAEPKELGQYSFKTSITVPYSDVLDLSTVTLDCKINFQIEDKFIFSSADSGSVNSKAVTTTEGSHCTALKAQLESSSDEEVKEAAKLLNDSCTISGSASLKKQ